MTFWYWHFSFCDENSSVSFLFVCFVRYTTHDTGFNQILMWEGFVYFSVTSWLYLAFHQSLISLAQWFLKCEMCVCGGMLWLATRQNLICLDLETARLDWQKGTVLCWFMSYVMFIIQPCLWCCLVGSIIGQIEYIAMLMTVYVETLYLSINHREQSCSWDFSLASKT